MFSGVETITKLIEVEKIEKYGWGRARSMTGTPYPERLTILLQMRFIIIINIIMFCVDRKLFKRFLRAGNDGRFMGDSAKHIRHQAIAAAQYRLLSQSVYGEKRLFTNFIRIISNVMLWTRMHG